MRNAGFSAYGMMKSAALGIVTLSILSALPAQAITFKSQTPDTPPESSDNGTQPPDDTTPIIIPPTGTKNAYTIDPHWKIEQAEYPLASSFSASLEDLQQNLGILHNLNSAANRETLDELGRSYGNAPLGSDLSNAISGINTADLATSIGSLKNAVANQSNDFAKTMIAARNAMHDPSLNDKTIIEPILTKTSVGINFRNMLMLNSSLGNLNSNIESLNNTYINLLTISKQPPSVLISMQSLGDKLAALDSLANNQVKGFSQLGGVIGDLDSNYKNLQASGGLAAVVTPKGGAAKQSLNNINIGMGELNDQLETLNTDMADVLGKPPATAPKTPYASYPIKPVTPEEREAWRNKPGNYRPDPADKDIKNDDSAVSTPESAAPSKGEEQPPADNANMPK